MSVKNRKYGISQIVLTTEDYEVRSSIFEIIRKKIIIKQCKYVLKCECEKLEIWNQSNCKKFVFGRIKQLRLPHCSQRWWDEFTKL